MHFVADVPVRVPDKVLAAAPPATAGLGHTIFVQTEFQVIDRTTDESNEAGMPATKRTRSVRCWRSCIGSRSAG